jgi:Na+-translocating ferredoxin:NAD+ oxidoreductase subunit D
MITHLKPASGAHVGAKSSVSFIMWQVMLALLPATVFGIWCFGWPALNLFVITVSSAIFFEAICIRMAGRVAKPVIMDGSAILTGWLLAMTLPPWSPWWIGVVGSGLAIVLGKQVYGGLGQNLFNPAMLARVALLISFPIEMTTWANISPLFFSQSPGIADSWHITFMGLDNIDAVTGATTLGYIKTEFPQNHLLADILKDYSRFA